MPHLFPRPKNTAKKELHSVRLLTPALLGLALCIVCLTATTWAWLSASVSSSANTIQSAAFSVVVKNSADAEISAQSDGSYQLPQGTYSVQLSKTGSANGYFDLTVGTAQYRTAVITGDAPITVTVQNNDASAISFSAAPFWGTPEGETIANGHGIVFPAPSPI